MSEKSTPDETTGPPSELVVLSPDEYLKRCETLAADGLYFEFIEPVRDGYRVKISHKEPKQKDLL